MGLEKNADKADNEQSPPQKSGDEKTKKHNPIPPGDNPPIILKYPYEFKGRKISEFSWRRPKARDYREIEANMMAAGFKTTTQSLILFTMAWMFNESHQAIDEMDGEDYASCIALFTPFF